MDILKEGNQLNVYAVETLRPVTLCTNADCASPHNQPGETYCADCGSPLSGEAKNVRYLLKESNSPRTFAAVAQLQQMKLAHLGLLLFTCFEDVPFNNSRRYYLLEPVAGLTLATELPLPQEFSTVIKWGIQLAEALAYLHTHKIYWRKLTPHHITIEGQQARWTNFNTELIPESEESQAHNYFARDAQTLAAVLFYLCTGAESFTLECDLPEPLKQSFAHWLAADQAGVASATELAEGLKAALNAVSRTAELYPLAVGQSDVGSVRELNEDSFFSQAMQWSHQGEGRPVGLYVVADGMGGHAAGEVASGLVVETMGRKFAREILADWHFIAPPPEPFEPVGWLERAVAAANEAVFKQARQAKTDMGTTVAAALVLDDTAHIAHVGDSRVYHLTEQGIRQLTADHSLVERLVTTGQITPAEAKNHPQRHVIYRTVGDKATVAVDTLTQRLSSGDYLLLCSDGLSGMVPDEEMWRIVMNSLSLAAACQRLIDVAKTAGGDDNITVILVQMKSA
ncbi:MAG: Stp1/IreP family PP2C-type Ser/Thr phosphatase [Anaerolineae bacterium]